jgi:regulator of sirC expression with transglutaminase-like and TPR domain
MAVTIDPGEELLALTGFLGTLAVRLCTTMATESFLVHKMPGETVISDPTVKLAISMIGVEQAREHVRSSREKYPESHLLSELEAALARRATELRDGARAEAEAAQVIQLFGKRKGEPQA